MYNPRSRHNFCISSSTWCLKLHICAAKIMAICQRFSKLPEQVHTENISLPDTIQKIPGRVFVTPESSCVATSIHLLFLCSFSFPLCYWNYKTDLYPLQRVEVCLKIFSKVSGKGVQVKQDMLHSNWNSKKVVLKIYNFVILKSNSQIV